MAADKKTQHTPGPWGRGALNIRRASGAVEAVKYVWGVFVPGKGQQEVCCIDREDANAEADANLIASAPELLEALEAFVTRFDGAPGTVSLVNKARAAIAKARGK